MEAAGSRQSCVTWAARGLGAGIGCWLAESSPPPVCSHRARGPAHTCPAVSSPRVSLCCQRSGAPGPRAQVRSPRSSPPVPGTCARLRPSSHLRVLPSLHRSVLRVCCLWNCPPPTIVRVALCYRVNSCHCSGPRSHRLSDTPSLSCTIGIPNSQLLLCWEHIPLLLPGCPGSSHSGGPQCSMRSPPCPQFRAPGSVHALLVPAAHTLSACPQPALQPRAAAPRLRTRGCSSSLLSPPCAHTSLAMPGGVPLLVIVLLLPLGADGLPAPAVLAHACCCAPCAHALPPILCSPRVWTRRQLMLTLSLLSERRCHAQLTACGCHAHSVQTRSWGGGGLTVGSRFFAVDVTTLLQLLLTCSFWAPACSHRAAHPRSSWAHCLLRAGAHMAHIEVVTLCGRGSSSSSS